MKYLKTVPSVALVLFAASLGSGNHGLAACAGGPAITLLPTLGGSDLYVNDAPAGGLVTGFSSLPGDSAFHAFLYGPAIVDLGTLGGESRGVAVNRGGQVAGTSDLLDSSGNVVATHAFLYDGSRMIDLGTLGGNDSWAVDINAGGEVVVNSLLADDFTLEPFVYRNGVVTHLGPLGGSATAVGLTDDGAIAGNIVYGGASWHGFLWREGILTDIGTLGGDYCVITDLNASGDVVGESWDRNYDLRAFLYADGQMVNLGSIDNAYCSAVAVNDARQVIGVYWPIMGDQRAFFYSSGVMRGLGTLGGDYASAADLNNAGQVVGASSLPDGTTHAFVWQDGLMTDLNSFLPEGSGWVLKSAEFITDDGVIVGAGEYNGATAWFQIRSDAGSQNGPPVAAPGGSLTFECGSNVVIDGTASSDPDGETLAFQWSLGGAVLGSEPILETSLPLGTHTITLSVTDPCGAAGTSEFEVAVVDATAPVFTQVPDPATIAVGKGCSAAVPNLLASVLATDACGGSAVTLAQIPAPGEPVSKGTHEVVISATDAAGNQAFQSVVLEVVDEAPPVIRCLVALPPLILKPKKEPVRVTCYVRARDNCDSPVSRIVEVTCKEPLEDGEVTITGDLTLELKPSRKAKTYPRVYTLTVETTDASGNASTARTTVTVFKGKPAGDGAEKPPGRGTGHGRRG